MTRLERVRAASLLFIWISYVTVVSGCAGEEGTSPGSERDQSGENVADQRLPEGDQQVETSVSCVPDRARWEEEIGALVGARCGTCHGDPLQYGAPYTLTDYESLHAENVLGNQGAFKAIAEQVELGRMPPAGQQALTEDERRALVQWARCDEAPTVIPAGGFESDRPILQDPGPPPPGTPSFELRAVGFTPPTGRSDHYECFTFAVPVDAPRYLRRIETIVDDARVLHHIVLIPEDGGRAPGEHSRCNQENPLKLLYAWAPGQGALAFPEGGIRVEPGQAVTLQIHYNNKAGWDDVSDRSGVRIYHGPPEGPEVMVLTLGPVSFEIPAGERAQAVGWCELPAETKLLASFPHMHEIGVDFRSHIISADGREQPLINLNGWDFESQYLYETPVSLNAGDTIETRCTFENRRDEPVRSGGRTGDEMCFNFTYITPPLPISYCNQDAPPSPRIYERGECADETLEAAVPAQIVQAELITGALPRPTGEALADGRWGVTSARIFFEQLSIGGLELELEASAIALQGALSLLEGVLTVDLVVQIRLVISGLSYQQRIPISFSGQWPPSISGAEVDADQGVTLDDRGFTADQGVTPPPDAAAPAPTADAGRSSSTGLHSLQSDCGEIEISLALRAGESGQGKLSAMVDFGSIVLNLELELREAE
ncbi:MAG: hypothetical protein VYD19_01535 [Myxococcota bacterium]|nr:hypothetical protein [Myxococcota bacterium]